MLVKERGVVQASPQDVAGLPFNDIVGRRVLGNATSVFAIGSVLAIEFRWLLETRIASDLGRALRRVPR
eukprot:9679860-Lingulodinium_polyedra.AAC.1